MIKHFDDIRYTVAYQVEGGNNHVDFKCYEQEGSSLDGEIKYYTLKNQHGRVTENLEEAQIFLSGEVKWDGCSNWNFDEQECCMLHFCHKDEVVNIGVLMGRLYDLAKELLGPDYLGD